MTVVTAVAGPSRLPMTVARQSVRRLRPSCSARRGVASTATDAGEVEADEHMIAYREWLNATGRQYESVRKGQQATWLGGSIPFPTNPSFRPPPPLSNDLQNVLYDQLRSGSTAAQLSHRYNISKARIEAVRKLKDVEREFQRQRIPTQEAFSSGMEDLLGVRSPLDPRTKSVDAGRERNETTARAMHMSTGVERTEEERWDAGIGRGGAFGQRTSQTEKEGIERTVWEFRDEETELKEKRAAVGTTSVQQGIKQAVQEVAEAKAGSDTPEAHRIAAELAHPPSRPSPSNTAQTPSSRAGKFTFTNVSGQGRWKTGGKRRDGVCSSS